MDKKENLENPERETENTAAKPAALSDEEIEQISGGHVLRGGALPLKSIDLDTQDKEFITIVGPSGCGKSTTLRMVAGLEEISEGELKLD